MSLHNRFHAHVCIPNPISVLWDSFVSFLTSLYTVVCSFLVAGWPVYTSCFESETRVNGRVQASRSSRIIQRSPLCMTEAFRCQGLTVRFLSFQRKQGSFSLSRCYRMEHFVGSSWRSLERFLLSISTYDSFSLQSCGPAWDASNCFSIVHVLEPVDLCGLSYHICISVADFPIIV